MIKKVLDFVYKLTNQISILISIDIYRESFIFIAYTKIFI